MIKKSEQVATTKPVKENVVDGVLQNYLDQLLVTATQPQRVEKTIHIPESTLDTTEPAPLEPALTSVADIPEVVTVERISEESILGRQVDDVVVAKAIVPEIDAPAVVADAMLDKTSELIAEINVERQHQLLTDQASWSSQGVECLIFSVCGLKLAVPLLFLGGVHEIKADDINPLIGQQAWYLGIVHTSESNLQVIDTAKFIMPERSRTLASEGFKYLIQLEKTPWAIACQSIDDTVRLEASEIKWRGDRGKRTWLAGTVIEKMCALVDVSGLLQEVELNCRRA